MQLNNRMEAYMEINIVNLKTFSHIGVFEEEKRDGQEFLISINCKLQECYSYNSDDLEKTVNYGRVCNLVIDYMENAKCDLIETACEDIASMILQSYDVIKEITVEIHKPNAPVEAEFGDIYASCNKKWEKVYLSLGSNMGERDDYINDAIKELKLQDKIRNVRSSSLYTTKPYGNVDQDDFRNCICELECFYTPLELLDICQEIESKNGRIREEEWGPRTLDVDIILFGNRIIDTPELTVPHIDMQYRGFVLEPLCEIAKGAYHPVLQKRAIELYKDLQN